MRFLHAPKTFVAIFGTFLIWAPNGETIAKECTSRKRPNCKDGHNNLIEGRTDRSKGHPVTIKFLRGTVYRSDSTPSCYRNKPTVLLPGVGRLVEGEMTVPPNNYDLVKSGTVKMTIKSPSFDDPLCVEGVSQYIALPNSMCNFNLCDFIGKNLCEFLQRPGTHTIREMEQKIDFNSTLILPDAPRILGISLLDIFAGEFHFIFSVETEGKMITNLEMPINVPFVPLGLQEEEEAEDDHC
ncbi:hypothetical protein niasHS_001487 [Heterodera schachtii]|uniref:Uncharacterized protein n=1 Tax=Heterodera schachtii TaxID=97005 RepID=A0ABD2KDM3_HETSC